MKKQIILIGILSISLLFFPSFISAYVQDFRINIEGLSPYYVSDYYTSGGENVSFSIRYFNNFSAQLIGITPLEQLLFDTNLGEYTFAIQILDSSKNILYEKEVSASFYLLTNPPTEVNQTTVFADFPSNLSGQYLQRL